MVDVVSGGRTGLDGNLVVGLKDLRLEPGTLNASTGVLEELDVMS